MLNTDATRWEWLWRWRVTIMVSIVGVVAAVLRFGGLSFPRALVFDEVFYVRGAYSLLHYGYEADWTGDNDWYEQGDYSGLASTGDFVVHPMVGKLLIAAGMKTFGNNPFGWRFSTAILGVATCIIVALIARHLFRSTLWGGVAGILIAIDGMSIVLSRTALLDNFLAFFVTAAFALILADRARMKRRVFATAAAERQRLGLDPYEPIPGWGPRTGIHWWRWLAVVMLGLAIGTKWSGMYFAAAFLILSVIFDWADRRRAGFERWFLGAGVRAIPTAIGSIALMLAVYIATWWNWFATSGSWARNWAQDHPGEGVMWLPEPLRSLAHYHRQMWDFHTSLVSPHNYQSSPYTWLLQLRPTAFHFRDVDGVDCGASRCVSAVTALGHPFIWWAAAAALVFALWRVVRHLDLMALTVSIGVLAGWAVWLPYSYRTIFTFYSVAFAPFLILTLTWALRRIALPDALAGREGAARYSRGGVMAVSAFLGVCLIFAGFFLPLWTGTPIPYEYWQMHMWIPNITFGDRFKIGWI
ncbi:dolichyl-phosphate-mannose--protein mannosyltransferase [Demequina sp.]|uniref:dolichyl-phosphate-mannose--protein mannosyltransferase n=1 Tax=Demequina sp. TaxID=2050685 RepID=UPI003D0FBCBE